MVQIIATTDNLASDLSRDAAIFFSYAVFGGILFAACVLAARPRTDTIGFVLAPMLCLALMYENLALGTEALSVGGASGVSRDMAEGALKLRGAVQAFVIPLWLTALFEITYTVHKRRSANFLLGLFTFDQGHRASHSFISQGLRYSLWVIGIAVLLVQVTVNAPYMAAPREAARVARFTFKGLPFGTLASPYIDWQDATDLIPWVIFLAWALIAGASLWRYGTSISTDINATCINPWATLAVAATALVVAWIVSPHTWQYPYAVNAAELVLVAATAFSMRLIESNLRTLENWDRILTVAGEAVTEALAKRRWILSEEEKEAAIENAASEMAMAAVTSSASTGSVRTILAPARSPISSSPPSRRIIDTTIIPPRLSTMIELTPTPTFEAEAGDWEDEQLSVQITSLVSTPPTPHPAAANSKTNKINRVAAHEV